MDLPIPHVMVMDRVERKCLKPPPSHGEDNWVSRLQNLGMPSMFLDTSLNYGQGFLIR